MCLCMCTVMYIVNSGSCSAIEYGKKQLSRNKEIVAT